MIHLFNNEVIMLDSERWAHEQWPSTSFCDPRLSRRAVNIALATLKQPTTSIPGRFSLRKDVKGCYRFVDNKAIGHQMLQRQHYANVLKEATSATGKVLFIQDGSELIYNNLKWTDLGPTADANGNGIMFHSSLAVKFQDGQPQVIGLSGQKAWIRERSNKQLDSKAQETKESQVWQEMIDQIGPVPEGCTWVTVGDRGADIFSFIESLPEGWDCVIRSKHDRKILMNGQEYNLKKCMRELASMGTTIHFLRARKNVSREVTLQLSWAAVDILPPKVDKEKPSIKGWYVRAWCEEDPTLEWILFTKTPVTSLNEALEIVSIYRLRWLIEEYHKCLKTGCQIEEVQLRTSERLMALFGMLGVIATQLIQLKGVSRTNPEEPAENYVDKIAVTVLQEIYSLKGVMTVREFWRRVAMLVGFMGRKSDGNPGWKKIWEGWIKLRDMCKGVEIGRQLAAKGI
jgi:Transposase DNA-binding/Transposase DDE domain